MRSASEGASRGPAGLSAAAAAMDYLPVFLRLDGHPVVVVGGGTVALRKATWLRRAGARVTVVAPGVHAELAQQAARGELRQIAEEFTPEHLAGAVAVVAATADRATNASVAASVRERIEGLLPGRLGALARFMGARRSSVQRALGAFARRGFWERVASGPVATQLLRGEQLPPERPLRLCGVPAQQLRGDGTRGDT